MTLLADAYECATCKHFHPVELDRLVKGIEEFAQYQHAAHHPYLPEHPPLMLLQSDSFAEFRDARKRIEKLIAQFKMTEKKGSPEDRQLYLYVRRNMEGFYYVAKCMKANLPVCVREMERFYGFDEAAPTKKYIGVETKRQAAQNYNLMQVVRIFTSDPIDHWIEIKEFTMHIKPLWFVGDKVYQFPIELAGSPGPGKTMQFKCQLKIGESAESVASFKIGFLGNKQFLSPSQVKLWAFGMAIAEHPFTGLYLI